MEQAARTVRCMTDHEHADHDHHAGGLAELLDLDAEVLHAHVSEMTAWCAELAGGRAPRRLLDVGSGTGTGTFALLRRFPDAEVVALDVSQELLQHLEGRARQLGRPDRVRTVRADLDEPWPAVGPVDLAWASASLHHVADPDRALAELWAALRPGGLLAVLELDGFPRFLPDAVGDGLEQRCHAAADQAHAADLPHRGSDWGLRLSRAGFAVEGERTFVVDLAPPLPAGAVRYAAATLRRLRAGLADRLGDQDLAALDALLADDGPQSLLQRDDLVVRATRSAWLARRP